RELNNLKPNAVLKLGQILKVPGQENLLAETKVAKAHLEAASKSNVTVPQSYQVQSGDSLWSLARRYDTRVKNLLALNPQLGNGSKLRPGMVIKLAEAKKNPTAPQHYRVKKGDNLWSIAQGHKVSMHELAEKNNLSLNATLSPGQLLHVPLAEASHSAF
ncbi:LysM peptidoglycan-binding domain-containing protein, partial [Thiomicrorhabdus sp.]|uniref:LysM peptidoglycan-binding domain-containing protein n=1 Tax=Thiomicrorhabdus sp. TaxID=2039724 RepID=UPI0029C833A5